MNDNNNDPVFDATLSAPDDSPSLLGRVLAIGARLVAEGRLPQSVVDEVAGHYAICLIQKDSEEIKLAAPNTALVIGRSSQSSDADWQISDDWLSKRHLRLSVDSDGCLGIADLSSKNGVWVNDERLQQSRTLSRGDCIRAGMSLLFVL